MQRTALWFSSVPITVVAPIWQRSSSGCPSVEAKPSPWTVTTMPPRSGVASG